MELRNHLKTSMGFDSSTEGIFIARRRHLDALRNARKHINMALEHLKESDAGELCAEELRYAQFYLLMRLPGEFSSD